MGINSIFFDDRVALCRSKSDVPQPNWWEFKPCNKRNVILWYVWLLTLSSFDSFLLLVHTHLLGKTSISIHPRPQINSNCRRLWIRRRRTRSQVRRRYIVRFFYCWCTGKLFGGIIGRHWRPRQDIWLDRVHWWNSLLIDLFCTIVCSALHLPRCYGLQCRWRVTDHLLDTGGSV